MSGITAAGTGFVYLFVIDDYADYENIVIILLLAFLIVLVGMFFFCFTSRKETIFEDMFAVISGGCFSYGLIISLMSEKFSIIYLLLSIASAASAVGFIVPDCKHTIDSRIRYILIAFPLFTINYAFFSTTLIEKTSARILLAVIIVFPIVTGICLKKYGNVNIRTMLLVLLGPFYAYIPFVLKSVLKDEWSNMESIINLLLTAVIAWSSNSYIEKKLFSIVIKNEDNMGSSIEQDSNTKVAVYFNIALIVLGDFIYFIILIVLSPQIISEGISIKIQLWTVLDIALFMVLMLVMINFWIIKKCKRNAVRKLIAMLLLFSGYGTTIVLIWHLRKPLYIDWRVIFIIFAVLGSAAMLSNGYYDNLLGLHGLKKNRYDFIMSIILFVFLVMSAVVSIFPSEKMDNYSESGVLFFLISLCGVVLTYIVLPYLYCRVSCYLTKETGLIRSSATNGVAQDGFTAALILLIGGLIPIYYSSASEEDIFSMAIGIVGIFLMLYWPLTLCLKNNQDHYKRKKKEYESLAQKTKEIEILNIQMETLKRKLSFQNASAYFSVLPYLILYDLCILVKNTFLDNYKFRGLLLKYAFIEPEVFFKKYPKNLYDNEDDA